MSKNFTMSQCLGIDLLDYRSDVRTLLLDFTKLLPEAVI